MNHEYNITFTLTEEQQARLMALTLRYNRAMEMPGGGAITAEGLLTSLLTPGSEKLIDERMNGVGAAMDALERRGGCEACQV